MGQPRGRGVRRYYFDAYDNWLAGNRSQVPQAWLIAFDSAKERRTTGSGDLLLGMSAHINRICRSPLPRSAW